MVEETHNVPRYFADFVKQNASEIGRLREEIARTRGDLSTEIAKAEARTTWWLFIVAFVLGLAIAVTILTVIMTITVD